MPNCFICGDTEGTVHLIGMVYACNDHAEGTSRPYLEEGHID